MKVLLQKAKFVNFLIDNFQRPTLNGNSTCDSAAMPPLPPGARCNSISSDSGEIDMDVDIEEDIETEDVDSTITSESDSTVSTVTSALGDLSMSDVSTGDINQSPDKDKTNSHLVETNEDNIITNQLTQDSSHDKWNDGIKPTESKHRDEVEDKMSRDMIRGWIMNCCNILRLQVSNN